MPRPTSNFNNDRIHSGSELSNQSDTVQSMAQQSHSGSFVHLKGVVFGGDGYDDDYDDDQHHIRIKFS